MILDKENIFDLLTVTSSKDKAGDILPLFSRMFAGSQVRKHILAQVKTINTDIQGVGEFGICCSECRQPLILCQRGEDVLYARHLYMNDFRCGDFSKFPSTEAKDISLDCSKFFDSDSPSKKEIYKGVNEGERHKKALEFVARCLSSMSGRYQVRDVELNRTIFHHTKKYEGGSYHRRFPDVFCIISDQPVAIEIQRAWLSPKEIMARENFYQEMGIKLVWVCLYSDSDEDSGCIISGTGSSTRNMVSYGSYISRWDANPVVFYLDEQCRKSLRFDVIAACWDDSTAEIAGKPVKGSLYFNQLDFSCKKSPLVKVCPISLMCSELLLRQDVQEHDELKTLAINMLKPRKRTGDRLRSLGSISRSVKKDNKELFLMLEDLIAMIKSEYKRFARTNNEHL